MTLFRSDLTYGVPVSDAAQKYGGDSIHPIWSKVGTTSFVGLPSSCGKTQAKFHTSPSWQSSRQKPSLISHLAMNIFASFSVCAKAWMMREIECPNWSIAPTGAVFTDASFTAGMRSDSLIFTPNDKSKIAWNFRDLWGIMAIGDIFNCAGGMCLMSSHSTTRHCPIFTFAATSACNC